MHLLNGSEITYIEIKNRNSEIDNKLLLSRYSKHIYYKSKTSRQTDELTGL